jgi:hypothetical protein
MYSYDTEAQMPADEKQAFAKRGHHGAKCGYMRKTTALLQEVTCFYCLKAIARELEEIHGA